MHKHTTSKQYRSMLYREHAVHVLHATGIPNNFARTRNSARILTLSDVVPFWNLFTIPGEQILVWATCDLQILERGPNYFNLLTRGTSEEIIFLKNARSACDFVKNLLKICKKSAKTFSIRNPQFILHDVLGETRCSGGHIAGACA